jgi:hypothetical protein
MTQTFFNEFKDFDLLLDLMITEQQRRGLLEGGRRKEAKGRTNLLFTVLFTSSL